MKVSVQDFFQDFYDSQIFHPVIMGQDLKWTYIDVVYDSIVKIDKLFNSVDRNLFRKEMLAVRMEIVALAFQYNIKNEQQPLNQSFFTKKYLDITSQSELWDVMGEYNKVILRSIMSIPLNEHESEALISKANSVRFSLYYKYKEKYSKEDVDGTCISRFCMRECCEVALEHHIIDQLLAVRLAERVGCNENINPEAIKPIMVAIWGFYQGAKEAIKPVNFG